MLLYHPKGKTGAIIYRFLYVKYEYSCVNILPIGYKNAIIVHMADRTSTVSRAKRDNRRFTDNLQRHSKILFEANRELRRATRAKAEFATKLSHEFRAALNVIVGFTELMLDEVPGPINEQQKQSLNDILASSRRLLALVNEYLEQPELERQKVIRNTYQDR